MRWRSRFWTWICACLCGGLLAVGTAVVPAVSQIDSATILATIGDAVFVEDDRATTRDTAEFGEEIRTENALAEVEFNNAAIGRMGEYARAIVGQCVEVENGQLLVSGPVNGCLSGFEAQVQGTIYLIDTTGDRGELKVLEGEVLLVPVPGEDDIEIENIPDPVLLRSGEKIFFPGRLQIDRPRFLSGREFSDILTGNLFREFDRPLPGQDSLPQVCRRLFPRYPCPERDRDGGFVRPKQPGPNLPPRRPRSR